MDWQKSCIQIYNVYQYFCVPIFTTDNMCKEGYTFDMDQQNCIGKHDDYLTICDSSVSNLAS